MKQLTLILFLFAMAQPSWAQNKGRFRVFKEKSDKRATIKNSRPLSVFYENLAWNQDPGIVEAGYLYLRDKDSGSTMEIKLIEILPDSGVFSTEFPVGSLQQKQYAAEVYSVPLSMLKGKNRMELAEEMIENGSIKRKPFLLRVIAGKGQIVDVFDDKSKALASYNKYREQMGLDPDQLESQSIIEVTNKEKPTTKKVIDTSTLQSLFMANENDIAATIEKNNELREVMKNMEIKRRDQVKADGKNWSGAKRDRNKNKANDTIKQAVKEMKDSKFSDSVDHFYEASNLNPANEDIYEQYGVSLFRNKKYNQAIVVLEISNPSPSREAEKNFYLGLSHYNLQDYLTAISYFDKVMQSGDKAFASTAAFYKGSSLLEIKEYEKSKEAFQYVLDNSNDPNMDKRAEKFIEYSIERKALDDKRANWINFSGVLGLIYDSNIVLANDQARDQGSVTGEKGVRLLGQLGAKMRPYYSQTDEINVKIDFTGLKSFDEGFGSNPVAERADPYLVSLGVPWTHRGTMGGKGYFFDLIPKYETIIMDLDGTGMGVITNSVKLDFNNTLVVSRNWIAKGDWFVSSNDSDLPGDATGADSFAGGLKLSSIYILNKDLEQYLIPEFGYRINDAKSATYAFNRIDLGVSFTTAAWEGFMWNNRLGYYLANYESSRTDNNYSLTSGLSTKLGPNWNWGLMGSYIINDSTTNQYKKYNFVSTFSFSY